MTESRPARHWPGAWVAALAVTLATGVLGGWLHLRMATQQTAAAAAAFDLNQAMDLAGAQVPPDRESFYFFILERATPDESIALADKMGRAADEGDFVGITGADADHNRQVLLTALRASGGRKLAGLVIIYVGPPDQEAELSASVKAAGAELRFVPYSATPVRKAQETI